MAARGRSWDFGNEKLIASILVVQRYESRSSRKRQDLQAISASEVLALKRTEV
jgi:hypothetical protein